MLDKILEESTDQHFHALIQTRNFQRRRDVIDDSLASEMIEETAESMWEPPEVLKKHTSVKKIGPDSGMLGFICVCVHSFFWTQVDYDWALFGFICSGSGSLLISPRCLLSYFAGFLFFLCGVGGWVGDNRF